MFRNFLNVAEVFIDKFKLCYSIIEHILLDSTKDHSVERHLRIHINLRGFKVNAVSILIVSKQCSLEADLRHKYGVVWLDG